MLERLRRDHRNSAPRVLAGAQDLAYSVIRRYGRLGFFLQRLLARPLDPPELTGLLLIGLHELDSPDTPDYAAINEAVSLAGLLFPRARGLVNGVLRNFQRRRDELNKLAEQNLQARWDFPTWWQKKLRTTYPNDWRRILAEMNGHPPMTLRINTRQVSLAIYCQKLEQHNIGYRLTGECALTLDQPIPVQELPGFEAGQVSVQDLGAQYAATLLDASDGMRVLDACAAPGGKTAHLLELFELDLDALDADALRLRRVADNLTRLALAARLVTGDAGMPEAWWDREPYDRILLDAPCTASGVIRRHPDGKWLKRPEDATHLAIQQARLLDAVWPMLKQGGKLLYATCSLFQEENELQAVQFLERHGDARREELNLPGGLGGQLLPSKDQDGFFYARFVKT